MRRLLLCTWMMVLMSACGMCSKKETVATQEAASPSPTATTSPAAANACDELKCGSEISGSGKAAITAPTATAPAPAAPRPVSTTTTPVPSGGIGAVPAAAAPPPPKLAAPSSTATGTAVTPESSQQLRLSRDPFRKYIGGDTGAGRYPELTNLPLASFRYVGIVKNEGENLALLEDHAGNGHTVRVGTRIGKEGGQISEISEQEIVVKTTRKDGSGRLTTKYFRLPFYVRM